MSCHMVELLLGSPSVDLSPTERALLADHLAHCRTCRAQHAEFTRLDYLLHQHMAMTPVRDMTETWAKLHTSRTRWAIGWGRAWYALRYSTRSALPALTSAALLFVLLWAASLLRPALPPSMSNPSLAQHSAPLSAVTQDRIWLISASPKIGTQISGKIDFEVQLGYKLYSASEAVLSVRVADVPTGQTRYFSPPQRVAAREDLAVVRFTLDGDRARTLFGAGPVQLEATLRTLPKSSASVLLANETFSMARYDLR